VPAVATVAGLPNKLGKYELLMPLAAGGMARIYIGRSTGIGSFERHVVLKLITPERANDHTAVQMFLDEARLAASLNHQNVAQVFEVGEDLGIHYLAMEYVHGQDLRALLAKAGSQGTRIPLDLALTVVAGAAAGLNHAHERRAADGTPLGIVHRDVSPSNIMIGYDGSVKLLDFGIAKATSRSVETQSGIIKGKFAYMAPEQCRGRDVDKRSDVFSLGIILYEITTQHRCFRADSDFDTMHRIVTGDVVRPTRLVQGYPAALEAIVMKALAVDAVQRYQSAALLLEALEAFSIASRYSLSTMGLGRFMRDMFGEISEPWLGNWTNPVAAKESTISSTDGRSEVGPSPLSAPSSERANTESEHAGVPELEARFPDSGGIAARTMLDMPGPGPHHVAPGEGPDDSDGEPLTTVRSSGSISVTGPHAPPSTAFTGVPGSGSGPAHAAMQAGAQPAIASTRHGYASGGAMTAPGGVAPNDYPRYEPTGEESAAVQLRPNRWMLIVGVAVIALGVIAIVAIVSGGSKSKDNDGIVTGSDTGSADTIGSAEPPPPPPAPTYIKITVSSTPKGADVLIAGDKVGVTPFVGKLNRGTAVAPLVVRMAGYGDFTSKIDLSGDEYTNERITLAKAAAPLPVVKPDAGTVPIAEYGSGAGSSEEPDPTQVKEPVVKDPVVKDPKDGKKPSTSHPTTHPGTTHPTTTTHTSNTATTTKVPPALTPTTTTHAAPKCQPNGQINPYDTSCDGKACPPCK
jgi:serine/threonine protein kinase